METNERGDGLDQRAALETRVREVLATQAAVDALREEHLTFGERAADRLAAVAGSWTFIFTFLGVLALWIGLNAFAWTNRWDPYPFILLNLLLSILAASRRHDTYWDTRVPCMSGEVGGVHRCVAPGAAEC